MTTYGYIFGVLAVGMVAFAVYARAKRGPLPVKFESFDELNSVADVCRWAQQQFERDDPRCKAFAVVLVHLQAATYFFSVPFTVRISAQDLALLAPFIDQSVEGKGPPSARSAEYEDWRPAALKGFKARMQREGLWPQDPRPHTPSVDAQA